MANRQAVIRQLDKFVSRLMANIAVQTTSELVKETPIDTGFAQSNWIPTIRGPFVGTVGIKAVGGVTRSPQQVAISTIQATYKLTDGNLFVTNNTPYILSLNDGSSTQAPSGFVQIAIAKAITKAALSFAGRFQ